MTKQDLQVDITTGLLIFPTWKRIRRIGTCDSVIELRRALRDSGSLVSESASSLFERLNFQKDDREVELVKASGVDLRFTSKEVTQRDIYTRAVQNGLSLCWSWIGPELRLQYQDQPDGESMLIGAEPLRFGHNNTRCLFGIQYTKEEGRRICTVNGDPDCRWLTSTVWVFQRSE